MFLPARALTSDSFDKICPYQAGRNVFPLGMFSKGQVSLSGITYDRPAIFFRKNSSPGMPPCSILRLRLGRPGRHQNTHSSSRSNSYSCKTAGGHWCWLASPLHFRPVRGGARHFFQAVAPATVAVLVRYVTRPMREEPSYAETSEAIRSRDRGAVHADEGARHD